MSSETSLPGEQRSEADKWQKRRDIPLAILAWITLVVVIGWGASYIKHALISLLLAALLAFAIAPAVKLLQRVMPHFLAILIVYLILLIGLISLCYLIVNTAIHQTHDLALEVGKAFRPGYTGWLTPIEQTLNSLGITQNQLTAAHEQILGQMTAFARDSVSFLRTIFDFAIDTIVISILSVYLVIDGPRVADWLRNNAPKAVHAHFFLETVQRVISNYLHSQLILATLIGLLVGLGMQFIFHLPYSVFLGVLAFAMAFIPVLGTAISGAVCALIALSLGWPIALGVLGYFVVVHIVESHVVGPRIVGKSIGLHPIVSLFALVAGAELFGIWGALFASPLAGILQVVLIAYWKEWRTTHPEQF